MENSSRFKFRAWDGVSMFTPVWYEGAWYESHEPDINDCQMLIDPIIMQSTGLKDKNGTLIFEHDILIFQVYNDTPESKIKISVMFDNGAFRFGQPSMIIGDMKVHGCFMSVYNDGKMPNYEIIGNIHENPELLTEKESE